MNRPYDDLDAILADIAATERDEPSAALRRQVAEIPLRHPRPERYRPNFGRLWTWSSAGLFALCLGAGSGWWLPSGAQSANDQDDWDELTSIALGEDLLGGAP